MAFLTLVLTWMSVVLALAIWEQKVTGDLTRIGRWSERDFGFHKRSPAVETLANATDGQAPDVAVLGDSFSNANAWQSVTSRSISEQFRSWGFVEGKTCLKQWVEETLRRTPSVKVVVFETVERNAINRASEHYDCALSESRFVPVGAGAHVDSRVYWPLTLNPQYLLHTLVHTVQQGTRRREIRAEVNNVPLKVRGLFSNRRDDRMLYFADDEGEWSASAESFAEAVNNLSELSRDLERHNIRFVFLMVPDKSHVYRDVMISSHIRNDKPDFPKALRSRGVNAPDILGPFKRQAMIDVDFYLPDDTHLSSRGFEFLGQTMAKNWPSPEKNSP